MNIDGTVDIRAHVYECMHECMKGLDCMVRDMAMSCQKRPTLVSKEAYTRVNRGLYSCQKRPTLVSKEAYTSVKRGLH